MHTEYFPDELKRQMQELFANIQKDRPRYLEWIKAEIAVLIASINKFDKVYVLGSLGARLIKAMPNSYSQFLENYQGLDEIDPNELVQKDDEIELLLEYAMSIAVATPNTSVLIPNAEELQAIYDQLSKIKYNMGMWEMSAELPEAGNQSDHWLRTQIVTESINVRGSGYHIHITEIFEELFAPFSDFLNQYYHFSANDLLRVILKLDSLVYSKVGNPLGSANSHDRLKEWMSMQGKERVFQTMMETGKHFIQQFTDANPDLKNPDTPDSVLLHSLDDIAGYPTIFWVIPHTETEKAVFEKLAAAFGDNQVFFQPEKFKAFILNDTIIKLQPLVKEKDKFYHFSLNLAFRNIFRITENLIKSTSEVYFENHYQGNTDPNSKDNYIERKTKRLFEKLLPSAGFYSSLDYFVPDENGKPKKTELDIIGISADAVYIIEVKAGLLNDKHKRGALKGLKLRLEQTVAAGSYQGHRALKYITDNERPEFSYVADKVRKQLIIDKSSVKSYYKITVTFEHLAGIASNLKYLISSGVMSEEYKWSWIISIFDLMVFADLMPNETKFKEYLDNRLAIYDREDISFSDELDILGYHMEGHFPLGEIKKDTHLQVVGFKDGIDLYYEQRGTGIPTVDKSGFK
ncbi:hypothetical protein [Mucilaginibacter sp. UR6-11]|uniref:hypothetical protein n=1 Tax=Mucilaginibacter sp. UR6-11 TaxID=1435644 RepID=UPI001E51D75B|nr:hypothetical protein [Mucilaginibacter sp. UR6-11]MCC8423577.1 hypothetical protein [Mucilaginibacter sp. UR6-11]